MPKGNWRKSTICDPRPVWCSLLNENQIEFDVFAHLKNWMCAERGAVRSPFPLFFEASQSSPVSQVGGGASDTPRRFAESGQRRRCFQPRPSDSISTDFVVVFLGGRWLQSVKLVSTPGAESTLMGVSFTLPGAQDLISCQNWSGAVRRKF